MDRIAHIYRLGLKELISIRHEYILIFFLVYSFSALIIVTAKGTGLQVNNASVAIVDEDRSPLSARIRASIRKPYFQTPRDLTFPEIGGTLARNAVTFIIDIPPGFQSDVLAGRQSEIRIDVDGTAIGHAKMGTTYLKKMIAAEISAYLLGERQTPAPAVQQTVRVRYNPNRQNTWFMGLMMLVNMITMLSIILPAAALLREREHGTVEHLLVMPLSPPEIMIAKVWANSLVVLTGAIFSLWLVVRGVLGAPVAGSFPLFLAGTVVYLFATTGLGILLATIARNGPQLGLLCVPVITPITMLSGAMTPLEAMPAFLQTVMSVFPTTHYVQFSSAVLIRGAGTAIVWEALAAMALIGAVLFLAALFRFRATFR